MHRLLKLANTPLFPSVKYKNINSVTVPREDWDMIRGFIAGIDDTENIPLILIICQQNMGQLLYKRTPHRTKKRFCTYDTETHCYSVNLRQVIFVFAELFYEPSGEVFKAVYPNLTNYNNFGVTVKKLTNITTLVEALKNLYLLEPYMETGKITKNYILKLGNNLKVLPNDFKLNEKLVW